MKLLTCLFLVGLKQLGHVDSLQDRQQKAHTHAQDLYHFEKTLISNNLLSNIDFLLKVMIKLHRCWLHSQKVAVAVCLWVTELHTHLEQTLEKKNEFKTRLNLINKPKQLGRFSLFTLVTMATPPSSLAIRPCMTHLNASFTWMTSPSLSDMHFSLNVTRDIRKWCWLIPTFQNKTFTWLPFSHEANRSAVRSKNKVSVTAEHFLKVQS